MEVILHPVHPAIVVRKQHLHVLKECSRLSLKEVYSLKELIQLHQIIMVVAEVMIAAAALVHVHPEEIKRSGSKTL